MVNAGFQGADALKETFLKGAPDAHGLAGGLHLGREGVVGVGEFVEGEARHLRYDVVESRFEGGRGVRKRNLIKRHADANLGGDAGDGVAAGFGRQSGRARHTGIDLD